MTVGDIIKYRCYMSHSVYEAKVLDEIEDGIYQVQHLDTDDIRYVSNSQITEIRDDVKEE